MYTYIKKPIENNIFINFNNCVKRAALTRIRDTGNNDITRILYVTHVIK